MKSLNPEAYIFCSIDPITLGTLAVGAASSFAGSAAAKGANASEGITVKAGEGPAAEPAAIAQSPTTKKPTKTSGMPSFIGGAGALPPPSQQTGGKTLLGQ